MTPSEPAQGGAARPIPLRQLILMAGAIALGAVCLARWGRTPVPPPARAPETPRAEPLARPPPPAESYPTRLSPEELSDEEAGKAAAPLPGAYRREIARPRPVRASPAGDGTTVQSDPSAGAPSDEAGAPLSRRRDDKKTLPEIFHMPPGPTPAGAPNSAPEASAGTLPGQDSRKPPESDFAPFGRLLKCELVASVDSVTARTEPIVALATEDLDWNGRIIIPAGSEVFSYARPEPILDGHGSGRLVDTGEWTIVLPSQEGRPNGRELALRGRAIDRREEVVEAGGRVRSWGIEDGSDGLRGSAISTLDQEEVKLFAAAAVGGMAQGVAAILQRQQPAAGLAGALGATQPAPIAENAVVGALGQGTVDVMNQMIARIREEIARRGVYVRVPAGKPFYLFVEQTIEPGEAEVGLRSIPPTRSPDIPFSKP
jgi:hypothetical protein